MAIELKIPDIGENIEEIQVVKVLVSVGDSIVNDQPVLELETGKAVVEIPADQAGTIQEILVKEGESATVGQVFMRLTGSDAQPSAQPETATPDAAAPPAPEPPTTPASATTVPGPAPAPALADSRGAVSGDIRDFPVR